MTRPGGNDPVTQMRQCLTPGASRLRGNDVTHGNDVGGCGNDVRDRNDADRGREGMT